METRPQTWAQQAQMEPDRRQFERHVGGHDSPTGLIPDTAAGTTTTSTSHRAIAREAVTISTEKDTASDIESLDSTKTAAATSATSPAASRRTRSHGTSVGLGLGLTPGLGSGRGSSSSDGNTRSEPTSVSDLDVLSRPVHGAADTAAPVPQCSISVNNLVSTGHTTSPSTTDGTSPAGVDGISDGDINAESYEQRHVHSVYESIAPHFSSTRYKPWPFVATFLKLQPLGSVGLDVGCGNGKYLDANRENIYVVGSDRSASLVRLARNHHYHGGSDVAVADGLALPFPKGRADFVICVAVIHHLSTRERRVEGVRALLECVRREDSAGGGKVLVYVWALEQRESRRGWDESADQDQLVPWIMRAKKEKAIPRAKVFGKPSHGHGRGSFEDRKREAGGDDDSDRGKKEQTELEQLADTTYQRYYHLYRKGELEEDVVAAGGRVLESGYEKDNWWVVGTHGG